MRDISNLELITLVDELRGEIIGLKVDKFYEDREGKFRIRLAKRGVQYNIQCILSKTINKTNYVEKIETPTSFAMAVRNRTEGFTVEGIEQYNKDRIVIIKLAKMDEKANIIIEMFGKGNFIITDGKMEIQLAYYQQVFNDRQVRKGIEYRPPKSTMTKEAAVPADHTSFIYIDNEGKAIDYSLGASEKHNGASSQQFPSLGQALDEFYYRKEMELMGTEPKNPEAEELEKSIKRQEGILKGMQEGIDSAQYTGNRIMENMEMINRIIKAAQENRRITKEELQKMFPKVKVLSIDLKEKTLEIEV
jgi:predicted ribosome quality control (RQC) complex YloA/Tae2 family protein